MSGIFHEGRWYENTDMVCRRCGSPVYASDNPEYSYQCFGCDEDFYSIEVDEQDAHYLPPVMVARPVNGITLNAALEYLLDDSGQRRVFQNQPEAEAFLLAHGFLPHGWEGFYFEELSGQGCVFEIKGHGISRYYTSPAVERFTDFVGHLHAGAPRPIRTRIPEASELPQKAWRDIADNKITGFSCFLIINIPENEFWVNEDTGAGMAIYCFPFTAVMQAAASGVTDLWERLLAQFPDAKKC